MQSGRTASGALRPGEQMLRGPATRRRAPTKRICVGVEDDVGVARCGRSDIAVDQLPDAQPHRPLARSAASRSSARVQGSASTACDVQSRSCSMKQLHDLCRLAKAGLLLRFAVGRPATLERLGDDADKAIVGIEQVQVLLRIAKHEIEPGLDGQRQIRALDALANVLAACRTKNWSSPTDRCTPARSRVGADQPHRVEAHVHQPIGVGADRRQAGIDDDLVARAARLSPRSSSTSRRAAP